MIIIIMIIIIMIIIIMIIIMVTNEIIKICDFLQPA